MAIFNGTAGNDTLIGGLGSNFFSLTPILAGTSTPTLSITAASADKSEGNSGTTLFTFTVTRAGDLSAASSAAWTVAGSGTSPANSADFVGGFLPSGPLPSGTVTFAAGAATATITVEVLGDTSYEFNETFTLSLSSPSGATLGSISTATATIINDDPIAPADDYRATTATTGTVLVGSSSTGTIESAGDQDWFRVSLVAGASYIINLEGAPTNQGSLLDTFLRGIYTSAGVLIAGTTNDDSDTSVNARVTYTPTVSGDYFISAGGFDTSTGTYKLSVSTGAFSAALPQLSVAPSNLPLAEGNNVATPFTFTVTRTGNLSAASSAAWAVAGSGTSQANATDFVGGVLPSGTVTFAAGAATTMITVAVLGDTVFEPNETFTLSLSNPVGATLGAISTATATIVNDDIGTAPPAGKLDDFAVLQFASPAIVGADAGNDTYLISGSMVSSGQVITISDNIGNNSIQLANGLSIASGQATSNALQLTLSNGGIVTVLGANLFTYDVGGNTTAGIDNVDLSYAMLGAAVGVAVPTTGIVTVGARVIGTGPAKSVIPVSSKLDDFVVLQFASPAIVGADAGNDTYLISNSMVSSGQAITISDGLGSNSIQLAPGLSIASSQVSSTALQLTLSNGGVITVLGANAFTYDVGGNTTTGIDNPDVSYTSFAQNTLGVTIPNSGMASGGAKVIGGNTTALTPVAVGSMASISATSGADVFSFAPTVAKALVANTQVTVNQFNTTQDKFQFDLVTALGATTLAALNGVEGISVQVDPFESSTLVNFGPNAIGNIVVLTLTGVTNPALVLVDVV